LGLSPVSKKHWLIVEQTTCRKPRILFVINEFDLDTTWLAACHDYTVTGEIITVDDEQMTRKRKALERIRRARAEELIDWGCVHPACDVSGDQPSQVRININVKVQALEVEYKPGLFDFFRDGPRMRRTAVDRFTIEIAADASSSNIPALIEGIRGLSDIVQSYHVGEVSDSASFGPRALSAYVDARDDDRSVESRSPGPRSLDIWV
jgi:hypothetical protein